MPNNRRETDRHPLEVPVSVSTDERRDRAGMTRDLSTAGVLFHSRSKFAVGERVALTLHVPRDGALLVGRASGCVVRSSIDDNLDNIFQYLTAVRFEQPLSGVL